MAIKRMITGRLYDVQPVYIFLNLKTQVLLRYGRHL